MNPLGKNIRPNANLTQMAIAYTQTKQMQALRAPGIVTVMKRSDRYLIWDKGDTLRIQMKERAPMTEAEEGNRRVSNDSYFATRYAVKRALADEDVDDYGSLAEAEQEIVEWLTEQAYLLMVQKVADVVFKTSSWTGSSSGSDITPGTKWDASGSPLTDFALQRRSVHTKTGRMPTTALFGTKSFDETTLNSQVTDQLKHTESDVASEETMARLLKLERVFAMNAIKNTAKEGQTASLSRVFDEKSAWLGYLNPRPSTRTPAAYKIFAYSPFGGAGAGFPAGIPAIKRYPDPNKSGWWYEAELYFDVKQTAAEAGVLFTATTS